MRNPLVAFLLFHLLCTCGPAQGTQGGADLGKVPDREALFHSAYEQLDAAVLDLLLSDDFTITYQRPPITKDKDQFLRELAELRNVFPNLRLRVDSLVIGKDTATLVTTGLRTFSWTYAGQPGSFQEGYRHHWRWEDEQWLLGAAEVLPPPDAQ